MSDAPRPLVDASFAEAIRLRNEEEFESALKELERYDELGGSRVASDVVRGGILWTLGRHDDAATALRRVLIVKPRHETASGGLVHALLEGGRLAEARDEAVRYLRLVDSGEAAGASASLIDLYRRIAPASPSELEELACSLRRDRLGKTGAP